MRFVILIRREDGVEVQYSPTVYQSIEAAKSDATIAKRDNAGCGVCIAPVWNGEKVTERTE